MPASISVVFSAFLGWLKNRGSSCQNLTMRSRERSASHLRERSESLRNVSDAKSGVLFSKTGHDVAEGRSLREQKDSTGIDDREYRATSNLGVNNVSMNNELACLEEQIEISREGVEIDNQTILSMRTTIKHHEQKITSQQIAIKDLADEIKHVKSEMKKKGIAL